MAVRASGAKSVRGGRDHYFELVNRFPLRPIRSDEELDRAIAVVDELTDRDELGEGEADYLDVLGDLIEKYEDEAHPIAGVTDAEMLRHLIEARDVTQARLAAETGIAESTISEVLAGKRGLSRHNIGVLSGYFHVSPAAFSFD